MKKTLLAIVLTLALAVSCVFGLAACKGDDKPAAPTEVKVGKTTIGEVTTERASYDLVGTVGNYYTLTATVDDETCNDVYLAIGPQTQGYGRIEQFEYYEANLKVTVYGTKTVSNVVLVLEKVDAPVAPTPAEYEEISLSTSVVPVLDGAECVTYKLVIAEEDTFIITGDIFLGNSEMWADIIIGKDLDENGVVDMGTAVEIDTDYGTLDLEAGTYYVTVYAEDSFTISAVAKYAGTVSEGTPVTVSNLGATPVRYKLNGTAGKYYTVEAKVDGAVSTDVFVKVANGEAFQGNGTVAQFAYVAGETDVVTISSVKAGEGDEYATIEEVVLVLTEVAAPTPVVYPEVTVGTAKTVAFEEDGWYVTYVVTLEAGNYTVSATGFDLTGDYGANIIISSLIADGQADTGVEGAEVEINSTDGTFTVATAGQYYVSVYEEGSFTISTATAE